ncbi:universal stress protein [Kribbella shirazensis]|uniref:Nucleotide-binding universal stress UspA family protein n=1 Tax=Kribbella shirazensis TaxID=1105143 RepID=A0A7X5VD50_9ACTN|nr:nucleotide-binding universal stress UspA family protein [Kribbella shirazensis]
MTGVIVCGVDGSAAGQRAVEWAYDEARRRSCRLRAVTVWSWDGPEYGQLIGGPEEARQRAVDIQDEVLAKVVGDSREPEVEKVVVDGRPSDQLCQAARDADLLVVGSHGHGAFHDALVGSTSVHVIRHAPCPVVLLPDQSRRAGKPKAAKSRRVHSPEGGLPMF